MRAVGERSLEISGGVKNERRASVGWEGQNCTGKVSCKTKSRFDHKRLVNGANRDGKWRRAVFEGREF
jgi:hypothetical protein